MKPRLAHHTKILCTLILGIFPLFLYKAQSAEFVIINGTYYYSSGANAFTCHASPPYPSNVPANWLSPNDYWNGTFYAYYEVIDIPTDQPFAMQMGIFQYMPIRDGYNYYETCSLVFTTLQGVGSHAEANCGSPAGWWQHPNGPVDFTMVYDFESVGPVMYSRTPGAYGILYPPDAAAWAVRSNYFPCTIRVIVVAVSAGSQFSGWSNYINGGGGCTPAQQATPTYGIDYSYERTDKVVPTSDEYSFNSNMSGAVNGTGARLTLTPGQDVYFRAKASGDCYLASNIQHLDVPARPSGPPSYSIDYFNERTNENVSSTVAYSTTPNFTSPVNGTGTPVALTPGQDLYFWVKETSSSFASLTYHLPVSARPATPTITIDYSNEVTSSISSSQEWSTSASMTSAVAGTNAALSVIPGTDLYIRTKATASTFASLIQNLDVPNRPASPDYQIDYSTEKTSTAVPATDEYSTHSDMSASTAGTGVKLPLTPGQDIYFRVKATGSSFASLKYLLDVPARPTLEYTGNDTVTSATITMRAILDASMTGFNLTDLSVTNGHAQNLRTGNTFDVIGEEKGNVTVIIPYNKFGGASFSSNEIVVYYNNSLTGIPEYDTDDFIVYPNPSKSGILHIQARQKTPYLIDICSVDGGLIRTIKMKSGEIQQIDLQDLAKGVYFLKLYAKNNFSVHKVILE